MSVSKNLCATILAVALDAVLGSSWWITSATARAAEASPQQSVVEGNSEFALAMHQQLARPDQNLVFSPVSMSWALAMTYLGARGTTADAMAKVMRFPMTPTETAARFSALTRELSALNAGSDVRFYLANSIWPQREYALRPEFVDGIKSGFGASITPLDFRGDTESARKTINDWVEDRTQRKITELIPRDGVTGLTRLVLTNAVYFNGKWARPFNPNATRQGEFRTQGNRMVPASFMDLTTPLRLYEDKALQLVDLPYMGGRVAMTVVLPREGESLDALERQLTAKGLATWIEQATITPVNVVLPKFRVESTLAVGDTLKAMGMGAAFDSRVADFSGMDGRPQWLYISQVFHKAFIKVGEAGTEAAAATAVVMSAPPSVAAPAPAKLFRADRPFLFALRDTKSGSILFLGRVQKPEV